MNGVDRTAQRVQGKGPVGNPRPNNRNNR